MTRTTLLPAHVALAALVVSQLLALQLAAAEHLDTSGMLKQSGATGGIVVHLGCDDPQRLLELHAGGPFTVQGLDRDEQKVAAARKLIQSQGAYGQVSARRFDGKQLPYVDNLINLLIADDPVDVSEEEIVRALRPLGVAWIRQGDSWKKIVKPWPDEIDEWTHFLHSASGNAVSNDDRVGPPRRMQWTAGSLWGRSHEFNNSLPALVSARGRLFYIFDYGVTGMEDPRLGEKWTLIARDAFNGALLWERPLETWGSDQWRNRALRFFGGTMARRLVAEGDKIYCTFDYGGNVQILDAATGKTLSVIPGTKGTEEILVAGGRVICGSRLQLARNKFTANVTCYDIQQQKVVWQADDQWLLSQTLSVGPAEVVYHNQDEIVCLNLADGQPRWKSADAKPKANLRKNNKMLLIARDKVIVSSRQQIVARSLADGGTLWSAPGVQGTSMREFDLFFAQGHLWCSGADGTIAGYDIDTGQRDRQLDAAAVQSEGHHLRCYRAKATNKYLITQFRGVEFLSLNQQPHNQNDWLRGTCTYGIMPANGFLYAPPHSCLCFAGAMSKGFTVFAGATKQDLSQLVEQAEPGPLEKGPHYGYIAPETSQQDAWPSYRHDARRTGATSQAISSSLGRSWKVSLDTALTPPVAGGGRTFVAAKNRHTLHAFDSRSGEQLWTFTAGARIDSPPSIYRGLLVFGCADGYLYCLRADDGRLSWRRRMAPTDSFLAVDGQLESVWRLHGSVAIDRGLAYGSAGRSSYVDGGLFLFAVDIQSGQVKYRSRLDTLADTRVDKIGKPFVPSYHIEGAQSDLLVAQGGYIYLNQMKFFPNLVMHDSRYLTRDEITNRPSLNLDNKDYVNDDIFNVTWRNKQYANYDELAGILVDENQNMGERDTGLHLFTTGGFLDTSFFNRTFWMYSKTWTGFNHSNLAPKSGQMLVIGNEQTYALKAYTSRYPLSPKLDPETKGYLLIADDNDNEPTLDQRAWGKDKGMGFSRGAPPLWHRWLPVRVQAMVLAGNKLLVCGPPDVVDRDDPLAAFEGRLGSRLQIISAADGATLAERALTETPIFDGMIVADGRLFICTAGGDLICLSAQSD